MRPEYVWIGLTAIFWGGYPLVARTAGFSGHRGTLVLMLAGLLPITIAGLFFGGNVWPAGGALLRLLGAGLLMGCGLLAFYAVASSPMDASLSIPIVDVAMLIVTAVGAIIVFEEPVTGRKLAGIGLMLAGIWLLRPA